MSVRDKTSCLPMVSTASLHHIRLFYAAYFGAMGLILPYFPVYLSVRGLDVASIGMITGLLALARVFSPPLVGHVLDQRQSSSAFIFAASFLAGLLALLLPWTSHFWSLAVIVLGFGFLWSAVLPLTDGISIHVSEAAWADYGRLRVWGSIGFVLASLAGGVWLADTDIMSFPYWLCLLLLVTGIAARGFPVNIEHVSRSGAVQEQFTAPFFALLVTSFLMQASHGAYYGFYSLYLVELGYDGWQVGAFWVLGVTAEIVLMWACSRFLQNAAPARVLGICLVLAALRWLGIGLTQFWLWLALLQLLHAATFAAFHISAVTWVKRLAPAHRHAAAQGWYSACGFGLGTTLGIMACGWISAQFGYGNAFFACGAVALLGLLPAVWLPKRA